MLRQRTVLFSIYLLAFSGSLILALSPGASWTGFVSKPDVKDIYIYRLLFCNLFASPWTSAWNGYDIRALLYAPKSPFFSKFVDPKTFISKKTDILSNLFDDLGSAAYNKANAKPIILYGTSRLPLNNTDSANALFNKQNIIQDKEKAIDSNGIYKRGMFGPFASKFSPIGLKFGPVTPFSEVMPDYLNKTSFFRKRRSVEASSSVDDINSILSSLSYPKNPQIIENTSATRSAASKPLKEYLPGIFEPFGPGGPFGSVVDPSMFTAKKIAFLDTLFKNRATNTSATMTEIPTSKSTIVLPASFWLPSSVIPSPTEYIQKVSDFLDKLFDSIKLNATVQETDDNSSAKGDFMRSLKSDDILSDKNTRSLDDASSIVAVKDATIDIIISELGNLKNNMIATLNDLIAYEKTMAATAKRPFKPFPGMFPFIKSIVDPTLSFQQRMAVLSQVFDMLANLQKNITTVAKNSDTPNSSKESSKIPLTNNASSINNTLLDAILKKISIIESVTMPSYPASSVKDNPISRALRKEPTVSWVSYSENSASAVKRQMDDDLQSYLGYENNPRHDHKQYTRGVKMQMHQGYQSLPAGSVESVQAGGGSTPEHQGGGIKLLEPNIYGNLNKWADWMQYHKNEYQDHRHHHNQH